MAPAYRHVASGRVVTVREDTLLAHLVAADAGYETAEDPLEVVEETVVEEEVVGEELAETDPPSPISEDGIPVLTDPVDEVVTEEVVTEVVEETVVEEEVQDAGITGGRGTAPRTRARRRGDAAG